MLKIKVTEKSGASIEYQSLVELDYSALGHGKPERWVPASEAHDPADVLETEQREVVPARTEERNENGVVTSVVIPAVMQEFVKLKAEYTVEIQDISLQYQLSQCIQSRKAEYPSPEDFMNAYFDGGQAGLDALQELRLAVKAKYPKPGA